MKKIFIFGIAALTGAALGFGYWTYIGCNSGTCPITSSPVNSTLYGAVLGVASVNLFIRSGK